MLKMPRWFGCCSITAQMSKFKVTRSVASPLSAARKTCEDTIAAVLQLYHRALHRAARLENVAVVAALIDQRSSLEALDDVCRAPQRRSVPNV